MDKNAETQQRTEKQPLFVFPHRTGGKSKMVPTIFLPAGELETFKKAFPENFVETITIII